MDLGFLIARLVLGLLMAAHGTQKLFGWFGGYGLAGTGGFFESLGFKPGRLFAAAASLGEVVSGLLIAFGLFGPIGPALLLSIMIVAAITVHGRALFASANGFEVPLLYATGAVALALTGYGRYSLDALLGIGSFWTPALSAGILVAGAVVGLLNLTLRRKPVTAS
ncbi:MAG TPA: DoxX family protein [Thermoanaerobaculia bacterium]|jgi:putative oxidoreductase|nr:DoxX family protein [Thermoanaerobaculia bacterium]